jgi:hypothetical protein
VVVNIVAVVVQTVDVKVAAFLCRMIAVVVVVQIDLLVVANTVVAVKIVVVNIVVVNVDTDVA